MTDNLFDFDDTEKDLKKCTECLTVLPKSFFGKDSGANYLRGKCKPCEKKNSNVTKKLKKIHQPPTDKNYKCPICERTEEEIIKRGHKARWCLDHDHKTEKFRAYICNSCNMGISNLREDIKVLKNAVNYLKEHSK